MTVTQVSRGRYKSFPSCHNYCTGTFYTSSHSHLSFIHKILAKLLKQMKKKSTFLKILAEQCCLSLENGGDGLNKDKGVVYTGSVESAKDVRVAYVEQEPPMPSDITVADALLGMTSYSSLQSNEMSSKLRWIFKPI